MCLSYLYLTSMSLQNLTVPLFVCRFLNLMSLVTFQPYISILWLDAWANQNSPLYINIWCRIVPVYSLYSWVVVVLWVPTNTFTYLWALLDSRVIYCTPRTGTIVVSLSVCHHVSLFKTFSYLILPTWQIGGNTGICWHLQHKSFTALLCGLVGIYLYKRIKSFTLDLFLYL